MKTFLFMMAFALFVAATPALAADKIYTGTFSNTAVSGYDTVSYFTEGKPVKGSKEFTSDYQGAEWRFSSAENKKKFDANPTKYAPQYGGHCAWAVSQGGTASGDPQQWAIHNGKLYLNYNARIKADWDKDRDGFIKKADALWPGVLN